MANKKDNIEVRSPFAWLTQQVLPLCVVVFAIWTINPQRLIQQNFDIGGYSSSVAQNLTDEPTLEKHFADGEKVPQCPGESCPLNPASATTLAGDGWKYVSKIIHMRATTDAWRGTYFVRIDTILPSFAATQGTKVAFDIVGIAGKSWRMFVNGREKAAGYGGPHADAIHFISDGGTIGEPMVIGFEVDAGRSFAPGIISVSQPFLSQPEIAPALRAAYRGIDKERILPDAFSRMALTVMAALGCLFTPFHLEILAYATGLALWNFSRILASDLAPFPAFLDVDFMTVDATVRCAFYGSAIAFFALYFRKRDRVSFLASVCFFALASVCLIAGRTGIFASVVPMVIRNNFGILGAISLCGGIFASQTWWNTRHLVHANFRRQIALIFTALLMLCSFLLFSRQFALWEWPLFSAFLNPDLGLRVTKILELVLASFGIAIALEWALVVRDRQRVLQRFGMVIDPRVLKEIVRSPNLPSIRAERVIAMFVDLRSFSSICENFPPAAVNLALNEYLDVITTAVQGNDGIIDKFVGDAVMALWGVPIQSAIDPMASMRAVIAIRKGMNELNEIRGQRGDFTLSCGIGMHCGPAIFGPVGNAQRIDFTAIGPTINLSARLQALTKEKGADILISQDLHRLVADKTLCSDLGATSVRGFSADQHILRLLGVADAAGRIIFEDQKLALAGLPSRAGLVEDVPANLAVVNYARPIQVAS